MQRWIVALLLLAVCAVSWAQAPEPRERQEQAIEPRLERPQIVIPRIQRGDIELNLFAGMLTIENFGTNAAYGLRAAYHATEDVFLEASYGRSTISDEAFDRLFIPIFGGATEDVEFYNLSAALNVLPGEVFVGRGRAYTSALFLLAGAGNTRLAGEDFFTLSFGFGFRVLPSDRLSLRLDVRNHTFENDLLGESRRTHNPEITAAVGVYF